MSRWVIESIEPLDCYNGGDGNAIVEGPPLPHPGEPVEVVSIERLHEVQAENKRLRAAMDEAHSLCEVGDSYGAGRELYDALYPRRNEAQTKSNLVLAAPIEELQRKLSDKCAAFGLPPNFDTLMRHMENNHAATVGVQRSHIESLERQLKEAHAASCDEEKPCVK